MLDVDNYAVLMYSVQFGIGSFCSFRNLLVGHKCWTRKNSCLKTPAAAVKRDPAN
jgi:hypothetical protein